MCYIRTCSCHMCYNYSCRICCYSCHKYCVNKKSTWTLQAMSSECLQVRRTVKFLCCLSRGCHIVSHHWLALCHSQGRFLPTHSYLIKDRTAERQHKFSLSRLCFQPFLFLTDALFLQVNSQLGIVRTQWNSVMEVLVRHHQKLRTQWSSLMEVLYQRWSGWLCWCDLEDPIDLYALHVLI